MDNLSQEKTSLKRKLVAFLEKFHFIDDVVSFGVNLKKLKKNYIYTHLLVKAATREGSHVIFVSSVGVL